MYCSFMFFSIAYLHNLQNISGNIRDDMTPPRQQPEVINVTFSKVNGSMGLSIVAAKVSETDAMVAGKIKIRSLYCRIHISKTCNGI